MDQMRRYIGVDTFARCRAATASTNTVITIIERRGN
jgi:hypothetical protein